MKIKQLVQSIQVVVQQLIERRTPTTQQPEPTDLNVRTGIKAGGGGSLGDVDLDYNDVRS